MRGRKQQRSPAPERSSVRATRIRLPTTLTHSILIDQLVSMLPVDHAALLTVFRAGDVVDARDQALSADSLAHPSQEVFIHRTIAAEHPVPFDLPIIFENDEIIAVDKPHFLATMPRGRHVTQTVLIRLRQVLHYPELSPAHRLDRLTAGVLVLTKRQEVRRAYHEVFSHSSTTKVYEAVAGFRSDLTMPRDITNYLVKEHGTLQGHISDAAPPNAHTRIELISHSTTRGYYRLLPTTGKTHQLRIHLAHLGIPILHDPLYPTVVPDPSLPLDDTPPSYRHPLQLLARQLVFTDPFSTAPIVITSTQTLSEQHTAGQSHDRPAVS